MSDFSQHLIFLHLSLTFSYIGGFTTKHQRKRSEKIMKRKTASSQSTSDFKRLKAKVGKRAPKAVNATETSFRTSSLHIQKQTVESNSFKKKKDIGNEEIYTVEDLQLISSRGKLLSTLLVQLNHPSPSMRTTTPLPPSSPLPLLLLLHIHLLTP